MCASGAFPYAPAERATFGVRGLLTKEKCSDDKKRKNLHIKTEKSALSILTDVSHMLIFKGKKSDIWETLF